MSVKFFMGHVKEFVYEKRLAKKKILVRDEGAGAAAWPVLPNEN